MSKRFLAENENCLGGQALEEEVQFLRQRVSDLEAYCALIEQSQSLMQRKKTEEIVRKSEMLSMIGQMAAGVAHEIRNPLTSIKGFLQFIQSNESRSTEYFSIMLAELGRIEFIISEFLVLAQPQLVKKERKNLIHLLQNIIVLVETHAILNNVQVFLHFDPELPLIMCEESQLKQAFINIMKNAIEAMPDGGELLITAMSDGGERVTVQFIDDGVGVPEEIMPRLGEPFYTTKEKGTGLGLMVSYKIVENHRGHINVRSKPHKGTTVEIQLPTE